MIKFILTISLIGLFTGANMAQSDCFMITEVKIFSEGKFSAPLDILISDGKIEKIGKELVSSCPAIEGKGKTLLPRLVNAHVHAWLPYHLKNAMDHGVYTLQDMHSVNSVTSELRALGMTDGFARLYGAGYAATVKGGHGTQFGYEVPVIGSERNCYEFVDEQIRAGMDHVKIIYEPARPTLSVGQVDSLIRRTHYHGKKAVVHISTANDAMQMVRLDADGLVHLWRDRQLTDEELAEMTDSGVFVIPTATVIEKAIEYFRQAGKQDRVFTRSQMLSEILRIHEAGVMLLTGTDPPNFSLDYGESLHHEMTLFAEAGLSSEAVLTCASVNPLKAYDYETFQITPGEDATFFLADGDVEENISHTSKILSRWVKGIELSEN